MKTIISVVFSLISISLLYSQGITAEGNILYPYSDDARKLKLIESSILISRDDISHKYELLTTYVIMNSEKSIKNCVIAFDNIVGMYAQPKEPKDYSLYINNERIIGDIEKADDGYNTIVYKCNFLPGKNDVTFWYLDQSGYIDGGSSIDYSIGNYSKWNLSSLRGINVFIDLPNTILEIKRLGEMDILGLGKVNNNIYFIKNGYLEKNALNLEERFFEIFMFSSAYYDGTGRPTIYDKPTTADEFIKTYISASIMCSNILAYISKNEIDQNSEEFKQSLIKHLSGYSKDELRLLRNAFYAIYNYPFKDQKLKDFYGNAISYFPDYAVSQETITINESDKLLISIIQKMEKGEDPKTIFQY